MRLPLGLAALLLAAAAAAAPTDVPVYQLARDGTLVIGALPDVLSRREVRPHLTTGLTTSFVVTTVARREGGAKSRGAARIDVRWEPWDEVFLTVVVAADGRVRRETLASFERLTAWWRAQELPLARGLAPGPWEVSVELSVVPFSQSEERDAQRWFSTTVASGEAAPRPASEGASRLDDVVDLLMATSIQRRSIVRYAWKAGPQAAPAHR
ncbi:MAG TPA: hypothetical protein VGV61_18140 [Thermoanaerobaculia bacterium]|jgi:hypothetical protein|nr:hypothetical protein [Thermoanaerobaculia bacterium]